MAENNPAEVVAENEEEKYDDALGASATKLFGAFSGLAFFVAVLIGKSFFESESPFPAVNALIQLPKTDCQNLKFIQIVFALTILVHHFRVFAGFTFAEDDKTFVAEIKKITDKKKVRVFRFLKLFFLITNPLFVLCSRMENGWLVFFKMLWFAQTAAALFFDLYFREEMFSKDKDRGSNFLVLAADISFCVLSLFIGFSDHLENGNWLATIAGGAVVLCLYTLSFELLVAYKDSLIRMFSRMGKYLSASAADLRPAN